MPKTAYKAVMEALPGLDEGERGRVLEALLGRPPDDAWRGRCERAEAERDLWRGRCEGLELERDALRANVDLLEAANAGVDRRHDRRELSADEMRRNPRSRSALLRVAERTEAPYV